MCALEKGKLAAFTDGALVSGISVLMIMVFSTKALRAPQTEGWSTCQVKLHTHLLYTLVTLIIYVAS